MIHLGKKSCCSIILTTLLFSSYSYAKCSGIMGHKITGYDYDTASIGVGRINIISNYLQPVGSTLATGISNYNSIVNGGLANSNDETIILTCTLQSDKANLSWAFATNGDSRVGGFYEIPGYPGYYATQFPYVAIKLTLADSGQTFSRMWAKSTQPVQTEDTDDGGFVVRKKHIPKVLATLVKWSQPYGDTTDAGGIKVKASYCHGGSETMIPTTQDKSDPSKVWGADYYAVNDVKAGCGQPNGYINLLGTGGREVDVGTDSNSDVTGWQYSVPIGLNGGPAATFSYTPSCVVKTITPYVMFPTMSVSQLTSGEKTSRNFDVTLECDNTISKSVSTAAVSLGLQPSISAFNHAQSLGLIDGVSGGVTYLVSDDYSASSMAKGVGITLKNANGDDVNFVSWEGCIAVESGSTSYCPSYINLAQQRAAGWDPIMSGSSEISSDLVNATTSYRKTYTATLGQIPNITPTPGKIKATATVLIRYP